MKIAVLYYSKTGNTQKVANIIAQGMMETEGVQAKCMSLDQIDEEFLNEAKAVVFGTPTWMGDMAWEVKRWLDQAMKYKLGGKLGAAFATEKHIGGGADNALLSLVSHMLVKGMVVYSSGGAEGAPFIHFGAVCIDEGTAEQQERAQIFGQRIARKALELFA